MGGLFTTLFSKIAAVVKWFGDLFVAVFVALWDMITDAFTWVFDSALGVAVSALAEIPTGGIENSVGAWGSLPAEILNALRLMGLGEAIAIITAAITIRFTMQLIPFVRLGS